MQYLLSRCLHCVVALGVADELGDSPALASGENERRLICVDDRSGACSPHISQRKHMDPCCARHYGRLFQPAHMSEPTFSSFGLKPQLRRHRFDVFRESFGFSTAKGRTAARLRPGGRHTEDCGVV